MSAADFIRALILAIAPVVVGKALDAATAPKAAEVEEKPESFAAYVRRRA